MVMFNSLNSIVGEENQPRKTDQLLQPTDVAPRQGQSSAPATQVATTSIDQASTPGGAGNQQTNTVQDAGTAKQGVRSPSAVVAANQDVKVENENINKATTNAQNIAANQATKAAAYQPQAIDYKAQVSDYIDGKSAEYKPAELDSIAKYDTDRSAINAVAAGLAKTPDQGFNRLDAILARNNSGYGTQLLNAQKTIADTQQQFTTDQAAADARYKTAMDSSTASQALVNPYIEDRRSQLTSAANAAQKQALAAQQTEKAQEDAAANAQYIGQWNALKARLGSEGIEMGEGGPPKSLELTNQTLGNLNDVSQFYNSDDYSRLNRILGLQGQPTLAAQATAPTDLYQTGYDAAATQADFNTLHDQKVAERDAQVAEIARVRDALEKTKSIESNFGTISAGGQNVGTVNPGTVGGGTGMSTQGGVTTNVPKISAKPVEVIADKITQPFKYISKLFS